MGKFKYFLIGATAGAVLSNKTLRDSLVKSVKTLYTTVKDRISEIGSDDSEEEDTDNVE